MINTILVEDDLYIQKHLTERLNSDGKFCLVGVYRDASPGRLLEQSDTVTVLYGLFLWMCRHSTSTPVLLRQNA